MFSEIPEIIKQRMSFLEETNKKDRSDGTKRFRRLNQISKDTGKFLAILASNCPKGDFVEIGTSAGYSALWISFALKQRAEKLITYESFSEKILLAKETFQICNIEDKIQLIEEDFLTSYKANNKIAFCFIDCAKYLCEKCYDLVAPNFITGGIIAIDNAISHYDVLKSLFLKIEKDLNFDSLLVPIGSGVFVCRKK